MAGKLQVVKLEGELARGEEEGDAVLCRLERNKSGSSPHSAEGLTLKKGSPQGNLPVEGRGQAAVS